MMSVHCFSLLLVNSMINLPYLFQMINFHLEICYYVSCIYCRFYPLTFTISFNTFGRMPLCSSHYFKDYFPFSMYDFVLSGDPPFQMLELQLIMMMDLPAKMNPGIFVVASDCLEFFNSEGDWSLTSPGFTAFAHPSPIIIGTTHGVFVLDDHKVFCSFEN